ncbi:MAG: hypothetical protein ACPIOQ_48295 [Promethearchaeia archaeon]
MIARTPLTWRLGAEGRHPRREHEAVLELLGAEANSPSGGWTRWRKPSSKSAKVIRVQ